MQASWSYDILTGLIQVREGTHGVCVWSASGIGICVVFHRNLGRLNFGVIVADIRDRGCCFSSHGLMSVCVVVLVRSIKRSVIMHVLVVWKPRNHRRCIATGDVREHHVSVVVGVILNWTSWNAIGSIAVHESISYRGSPFSVRLHAQHWPCFRRSRCGIARFQVSG